MADDRKIDKEAPADREIGRQGKDLAGAGAATPDVTGQEDLTSIRSVDLSLHGDGISHWQDEPKAGRSGQESPKKDRS